MTAAARWPTSVGQAEGRAQAGFDAARGSTVAVDSVAFNPDGHALASVSNDGTIRLWSLNVQSAIHRICAIAGGLTPQQWDEYIRPLPYRTTCAP